MGLGPLHTIGLAEARQRALECRKLRLDGSDPIDQKQEKRAAAKLDAAKATTFRQCAEAYIASHKAGWRNKRYREEEWPKTLAAYVYPVFGDLSVQAVDVGLVMKVIEPIWTTKSETAGRLRGRIESILDYAIAHGWRERGENPARWRGYLDKLLPAKSRVHQVKHLAALPYSEIGRLITDLRNAEGVAARALEFTILTASRTNEVLGACWDEINFAERLWTVPASRMKSHRPHEVPLSEAALSILTEMAKTRHSNFIFPGRRMGRPLSGMSMAMRLRELRPGVTVHGTARSTFRDWAAERTNFPREICEMALAHTVGSAAERAYQRSTLIQKRRQLAEAWAKFCSTTAAPSRVVALHAAQ
jgi:integrase